MDGLLGVGSFGNLSAKAVLFHDPSAKTGQALRCAILAAFIMISREEIRRERGGGKREEMRSLDLITFLSGVILQVITFCIYRILARLKSDRKGSSSTTATRYGAPTINACKRKCTAFLSSSSSNIYQNR